MNLEVFLRQRIRSAVTFHAVGSFFALGFGSVALIVTFWVVYGAIYWGFQWCVPHSHGMRLIISAVVLALLFIGNARTDRDYLTSYKVDTVDGREAYTIDIPDVGILSNLNFFSPNTVNSLTKMIAQLLFIAPQLISGAWRLAARSVDLSHIDAKPAARVTEVLLLRKGRVPFSDLFLAIDEDTASAALRDLAVLDAIQFLDSHPSGVMLTSTFRQTIHPTSKQNE